MWSVRLQLWEQAMNQRGFVIEVWLTEDFFKTVGLGVYSIQALAQDLPLFPKVA